VNSGVLARLPQPQYNFLLECFGADGKMIVPSAQMMSLRLRTQFRKLAFSDDR